VLEGTGRATGAAFAPTKVLDIHTVPLRREWDQINGIFRKMTRGIQSSCMIPSTRHLGGPTIFAVVFSMPRKQIFLVLYSIGHMKQTCSHPNTTCKHAAIPQYQISATARSRRGGSGARRCRRHTARGSRGRGERGSAPSATGHLQGTALARWG